MKLAITICSLSSPYHAPLPGMPFQIVHLHLGGLSLHLWEAFSRTFQIQLGETFMPPQSQIFPFTDSSDDECCVCWLLCPSFPPVPKPLEVRAVFLFISLTSSRHGEGVGTVSCTDESNHLFLSSVTSLPSLGLVPLSKTRI